MNPNSYSQEGVFKNGLADMFLCSLHKMARSMTEQKGPLEKPGTVEKDGPESQSCEAE